MQDGWKAVWSIPYVSVASFFPSLKHNFIAYQSSKVSSCPDCIFEIHQLWQSGFSRVYSNCCCSCSFEAEIIKIGQSSHKMYSNNILKFQESTTILNACTKQVWKLIICTSYFIILVNNNNNKTKNKKNWNGVEAPNIFFELIWGHWLWNWLYFFLLSYCFCYTEMFHFWKIAFFFSSFVFCIYSFDWWLYF